jgi:hypothetical protein
VLAQIKFIGKINQILLVQVPVLNEISSIAKPPLVALPSKTILKSVEVSTDTWAGRQVGRVVSIVFASITHSLKISQKLFCALFEKIHALFCFLPR